MNWDVMSKNDAENEFESFKQSGEVRLDPRYSDLRDEIVLAYNNTLNELNITDDTISRGKNSYLVDCLFGIKLFNIFRTNKYQMTIRDASTDGVWRFLSLRVVPDIVTRRNGIEHPDKYWKKAKRIWLRAIYWYIYLSWQGSVEKTFEAIKDNSTDTITQLVDRCGRGYRELLCRQLIQQLSNFESSQRTEVFRKVMVLNTARSKVVEPYLAEGGVAQYVKELYDYVL